MVIVHMLAGGVTCLPTLFYGAFQWIDDSKPRGLVLSLAWSAVMAPHGAAVVTPIYGDGLISLVTAAIVLPGYVHLNGGP